jgi:hypothetical protein
MKKPTNKQKIQMYEDFLHKINVAVVCGRGDIIQKLVDNADKWSYAHRVGNGDLTDKQQDKIVTKAFWKLCD